MKSMTVARMMVPVDEYATVSQDKSLYDAVVALERAQREYLQQAGPQAYPHRALLVLDGAGKVAGKLSQFDVLRALEPKYNQVLESDQQSSMTRTGFSSEFLRGMLEQYGLFDRPLADLCRKAAGIRVQDVMYKPTEGEVVGEDDTLEVAVHQLIVGRHQSLLVVRDGDIVGILRLVDVFREVCRSMKECVL